MALALAALCLSGVLSGFLWGVLAGCGGSNSKPQPERRPGATLQPPGEYSYGTRGFERLSAIVSSGHAYPRRSPVTVSRTACGFAERWEPRPERSSDWRFCVKGARWRLIGIVDYHEFFGQPVTQSFACRGPFVPRAPTVRIGFRWTDRCRGAGSRVTVSYEALRKRGIPVGGTTVQAVLIRAKARLRGRIDGLNTYDSWLSRKDGLLVRRKVVSDTAIKTPFGNVTDRERYTIELGSLTPR